MVKQHFKFEDKAAEEVNDNPFSLPSSKLQVNGHESTFSHDAQVNGHGHSLTSNSDARVVSTNGRKRAVDFFEDDSSKRSKPAADSFRPAAEDSHGNNMQTPAKRRKIAGDRAALPIFKHASMLKQKVRENNVIILIGETGSGKSTQLPQFLLEDRPDGCIAVTQPRRVAATNLAKRVSEEMDVRLGKEVGYSIRFDDMSSKHTKIKFLTDGMLLVELLNDPLLSRYSTVILDEAHERSMLTDLLLGFMKLLAKKRIGLKLIVMSATLDADRFSHFFDDAEVVRIEGRTFPVALYYSKAAQSDYLDAILRAVFQIHLGEATGDTLVFLTGSDEIENLATQLREYAEQLKGDVPRLLVLPLYATLPQDQQSRVFHSTPRNTRKVILATNIAETSITVPGVRYVLDCGLQKVKGFNAKIGFESLEVTPISQSNADQRAGRAGREAPGKCWRMYQEGTFRSLDVSAEAEIKRVELSQAILALKARGVDDVLNFEYIEPPPRESIVRALEHLYSLGALNDSGSITPIGKTMSTMPLPPALARVLIAAGEQDCVSDVIDIVSCLSVDKIFLDKSDKREEIAESRKRFESIEGDHLTLLNVFRAYLDLKHDSSKWCDDAHVDKRNLRTAENVRKQLLEHSTRAGLLVSMKSSSPQSSTEQILRAFLTGFISHTAFLSPDGSYRTTIGNSAVSIHPSSVLYGKKVEAIVYHESVFTTRLWVRGVSRVEGKWLREVAPNWSGRRSL